jgi:hypothetical protein
MTIQHTEQAGSRDNASSYINDEFQRMWKEAVLDFFIRIVGGGTGSTRHVGR